MPKLTKRIVDELKPDATGKDVFLWDDEIRGFGVRMKPSGSATFFIQYRTVEARTRRLAIGKVGILAPEQARKIARERLVEVANGADPSADRAKARSVLTVAEICEQYMAAARAGGVTTRFRRQKSARTVADDKGRVLRHINPLIGHQPSNRLTRAHVQRLVDGITAGKTCAVIKTRVRGKAVVKGGPAAATRTVGLLGGIWTWAERRGLVSGPNPARGVETRSGNANDRVLSAVELAALGKAMATDGEKSKAAVTVVRLIAVTGMRRQEACNLRWTEVDKIGQCLRLEGTKTGQSRRPIGQQALDILAGITRSDSEFVFPSKDGKKSADLKKRIAQIFEAAGLSDARSHDLRRTFASVGADLGLSEATIGELLGHARRGVTLKHYIRRPDEALVSSANLVSMAITAMLSNSGATISRLTSNG